MAVLPKPCIVSYRNTSSFIQESVILLNPGFIQPPLTEWSIFPRKAAKYRVDLEIVETCELSNHHYCRKANLAELLLFSRRHSEFFEEFCGIEGFDDDVERHGKVIRSSFTIPCVCTRNGRIAVRLRRYDRLPFQPYTLVVTAMHRMKK